ncbi:nuclear transport factor 2 family protein [Streptomyces sp. NBC_00878]|uniref:nuclear transport factor 2 family protein n=1 Tax=Streptomyces sp. NBC_00878 TaxID=2975854 RepID=UPI002251CDBF|nr:nuclear transport factor 2 family protein [Streptomyces sp. NBC_00878]MCX4905515.1 nuclear transport factor 2 family protein [Streptomyces sp. NBC_00878]
MPAIVVAWGAAWNAEDPQRLADLYVENGARYTDHAFGAKDYLGRDGTIEWANRAKEVIQGAAVMVNCASARSGVIVIDWTFSGQVAGAPKPFSVPVVTVLQMRGHQIVTTGDYYSRAEVIRQSGFPAETTAG